MSRVNLSCLAKEQYLNRNCLLIYQVRECSNENADAQIKEYIKD